MTGWLDQAACRGRPTEWWYPGQGDRFTLRVAQLVCQGCPVRSDCLAAALVEEAGEGYAYGVRGGLDARSRQEFARRQRRTVVEVVAEPVPVPVSTGRRTWPRRAYAVAL